MIYRLVCVCVCVCVYAVPPRPETIGGNTLFTKFVQYVHSPPPHLETSLQTELYVVLNFFCNVCAVMDWQNFNRFSPIRFQTVSYA
jgi:hypothetical protein